jgi:hypothetical protein
MDRLQQYMHNHREAFDDAVPDKGHFDRFEDRLKRIQFQGKVHISPWLYVQIAAVFLLLLGVSFFLIYSDKNQLLSSNYHASLVLPGDAAEAIAYYDDQANNTIREMYLWAGQYPNGNEIIQTAQQEINALDANISELQKALHESPNDERIIAAMIQNQQMKNDVLSNIKSRFTQYNR